MLRWEVSEHEENTLDTQFHIGDCSHRHGLLFTLILGALGEIMDYRMCVTVGAAVTFIACLLTIFRNRVEVRKIYEAE